MLNKNLYILYFFTATRFVIPLRDIQATEFDNVAKLDCTISNAKAATKWLKDGQVVETSNKFEIVEEGNARSLIVHDLKPEDAGSFSCVVGDVESVAQLNVEGEEIIDKCKVLWSFSQRQTRSWHLVS